MVSAAAHVPFRRCHGTRTWFHGTNDIKYLDRAQPACGWCTRNDQACEYKERKKPGLRAGYGRELESRLDRLESQLAEQTRQLSAHLAKACVVSPNDYRNSAQANSYSSHNQNHLSYNASSYQGNRDSISGLPDQATIDPKLRSPSRHGSHHYVTAQHQQQQQPNTDPQNIQSQNQYTPSAQSLSLTSPQPGIGFHSGPLEQTTQLPPYDLLYSLVDLYFRHINVWLPLLDRKTTLDRLFGAAPLDEADKVLLHAIVAVSLRYSRDPRLSVESRQHYHTTSKQRVQLFGLENSSVRSLQALTILALDVTGDTNGPPGWNLISLISRSVVQLGLAVEATSTLTASMFPSISTLRAAVLPEAKTWVEDEERRRLFWTVYLLDRYATVATVSTPTLQSSGACF